MQNQNRQQPLAKISERSRGATLVEYALLIALLLMVTVAAIRALGGSTSAQFNSASSRLGKPNANVITSGATDAGPPSGTTGATADDGN